MRAVRLAMVDWWNARRRAGEERAFHLERTADGLMSLGEAPGRARSVARRRFGPTHAVALAELDADFAGLARRLRDVRVETLPWPTPVALVVAIFLLAAVSPSARVTFETIAGVPLRATDRDAFAVSEQASNLRYHGLSWHDRDVVRRFAPDAAVTARGHVRIEQPLDEALLQRAATNQGLRIRPWFEHVSVPARYLRWAWWLALVVALVGMRGDLLRWRLWGSSTLALHGACHLAVWACAYQHWTRIDWGTDGRGALALGSLGLGSCWLAAWQGRAWWRDLTLRCPRCLQRFRWPEEAGQEGCILLSPPVRESICFQGHGTLVETRGARHTRPAVLPGII